MAPRTTTSAAEWQRWSAELEARIAADDYTSALRHLDSLDAVLKNYFAAAGSGDERRQRLEISLQSLEAARRAAIAGREYLRAQVRSAHSASAYAKVPDQPHSRWSTEL